MLRMSKPRTLYSPPRKNFSKIGSVSVVAVRPDVLRLGARMPSDVRGVERVVPDALDAGLDV